MAKYFHLKLWPCLGRSHDCDATKGKADKLNLGRESLMLEAKFHHFHKVSRQSLQKTSSSCTSSVLRSLGLLL